MPRFLPLGLDLSDALCVVVGGGQIGTRKVRTLLDAGARVTVIAPRISPDLAALSDSGQLRWIARPFHEDLLEPAVLVVAATNDETVNQQVGRAVRARGALLCDASAAERSQVIFGALHQGEDLTLAVFTNGRDPARARRIRDRIARRLGAPALSGRPSTPADARLIVVAHGSRDERWRDSIEQVIAWVQDETGAGAVALAYMDRAPPTLADAVTAALAAGYRRVRVLPLFLAPQGHVDRDIRPVVEDLRARYPELEIEFLPPIGQLPEFRELLCRLAAEPAESGKPELEAASGGAADRSGTQAIEGERP